MSRHGPLVALATALASLAAAPGCDRSRTEAPAASAVLRPPQKTPPSSPATGVRRVPPVDDGDPGMLAAVLRALRGYDGPIGYLGERAEGDLRFGELEPRIARVPAQAFQGRDSAPALEALERARARWLLVSSLDPPIEPWPSDSDTTVQVLLRDGVGLPRLQPVVIGRAHVLYRVAEPAAASDEQVRSMTAYLRALAAGRSAPAELAVPEDEPFRGTDGQVRVLVTVRPHVSSCRGGLALGGLEASGATVRAALDDAARRLGREWGRLRRRSDCAGDHPSGIAEGLETVTLQLELVHSMAAMTDRAPERLYYLVELGVQGAYLRRGDRVWTLAPTTTIHRALDDEAAVVNRVARWNGQPEGAFRDESYEAGRFETVAWVELRPGEASSIRRLWRGVPLVRMADLTREALVDALVLGARFLARNQTPSGEYRYVYRPLREREETRWARENNIVRHSLCPLVVLRAHQLRPDPALVDSARRGIDFTLGHLRRMGDRCHVWYGDDGDDEEAGGGNAKMGTVAALVLSIVELARSGEDVSSYQDELDCLANQILAMQGEDGEFVHYDVPPGHPFHGRHNAIYPGELMLALSRLHERTGEARYREAFDRAMGFQRTWFRRMRSETTPDGIYDERRRVDLISFEPWGVMALEDMLRQYPDERGYAELAFELVDLVDGRFQFDLERAQYPDYLGGYFKTQQELPAINSCGYTEGAAAAFAVALRTGERIEERRLALLLGLRFVLQLQYHPDRSQFYLPDQETASGGFRYNLSFSRVRNDYMYHAMNALALGAVTLRPEDYPSRVELGAVPEVLEPAFEGLGGR